MNAQSKIVAGTSVYAKIAAVQGELAKVGIAKNRRNQQGSGYNFRGIDDVYAALSPLLATHGLVIVPRVTNREVIERTSKNGGALFYVTVHAEFDFISADDGSIHTAATFGEAMDSGDKATNKAMSAAYKYAAFMTFAIPTEGDNDADAHTPEVAARGQRSESKVSPAPSNTDTPDLPVGPINDTTRDWLASKIDARQIPVGELCRAFGAASLKQITYAQLDLVKAWIADWKPKASFGEVLADEIPY